LWISQARGLYSASAPWPCAEANADRTEVRAAVPAELTVVAGQSVVFAVVDASLGDVGILLIPELVSQLMPVRVVKVMSGNAEPVVFGRLGQYTFVSQEHNLVRGTINVHDYNRNTTNAKGVCSGGVLPPPVVTTANPQPGGAAAVRPFWLDLFVFVSRLVDTMLQAFW